MKNLLFLVFLFVGLQTNAQSNPEFYPGSTPDFSVGNIVEWKTTGKRMEVSAVVAGTRIVNGMTQKGYYYYYKPIQSTKPTIVENQTQSTVQGESNQTIVNNNYITNNEVVRTNGCWNYRTGYLNNGFYRHQHYGFKNFANPNVAWGESYGWGVMNLNPSIIRFTIF